MISACKLKKERRGKSKIFLYGKEPFLIHLRRRVANKKNVCEQLRASERDSNFFRIYKQKT